MNTKKVREYNIDLQIEKGSITFKELAKVIGVHHRTIRNWFDKPMNEVQKGIVLKAINEIRKEVSL